MHGPPNVIFGIWAELRGRWCEELRMKRARMLELMGDENPTWVHQVRVRVPRQQRGPATVVAYAAHLLPGRAWPVLHDGHHGQAPQHAGEVAVAGGFPL
eukprot:3731807-Pyramimonas_sp.AAC.1